MNDQSGDNGATSQISRHRQLLAGVNGKEYEAFASLAEVKKATDGVVILDGNDASQIYVVCRAEDVHCSEETLNRLLLDLDELAWSGKEPDRAQIFYERHTVGSVIYGATGGGRVTVTPWIHTQFERIGLADKILAVLSGESEHI